MPSYSKEIAELEQLINSAVVSTSADGVSANFDLDAAKRRLAELRRLENPNSKMVRPIVSTLGLGGAW